MGLGQKRLSLVLTHQSLERDLPMNFEQYRQLCRDVSVLLELPDPERLANEGLLELDGISMSLFHDEEVVDDRLFCYVDLGPVDDSRRARVFERLLMLNLLSGTKTSGVYSLDPASGNPIFCVHVMHPERLDTADMASLLRSYAMRARQLQQSVMTDADGESFLDTVNRMFGLEDVSSPHELA